MKKIEKKCEENLWGIRRILAKNERKIWGNLSGWVFSHISSIFFLNFWKIVLFYVNFFSIFKVFSEYSLTWLNHKIWGHEEGTFTNIKFCPFKFFILAHSFWVKRRRNLFHKNYVKSGLSVFATPSLETVLTFPNSRTCVFVLLFSRVLQRAYEILIERPSFVMRKLTPH